MPRTLENHLVGVTADAPHPDGYRPDLPLRSELNPPSTPQQRYEEGYDRGKRHREQLDENRIDALQSQLADEQAKTRALTAQLEAKAS